MQIQVLSTSVVTLMSKANKPYQQLEIAFKNLTFGKVESKKLMPFGAQEAAFKALSGAKQGDVFEVTVVKNAAGFNDWTSCVQAAPGSIIPVHPQTDLGSINNAAGNNIVGGKSVQVKSTYETPAEREAKQRFIIRQSSISAAINSLSVGAKSALTTSAVLNQAQEYFDWVMQNPEEVVKQDVFQMPNDMDVEVE